MGRNKPKRRDSGGQRKGSAGGNVPKSEPLRKRSDGRAGSDWARKEAAKEGPGSSARVGRIPAPVLELVADAERKQREAAESPGSMAASLRWGVLISGMLLFHFLVVHTAVHGTRLVDSLLGTIVLTVSVAVCGALQFRFSYVSLLTCLWRTAELMAYVAPTAYFCLSFIWRRLLASTSLTEYSSSSTGLLLLPGTLQVLQFFLPSASTLQKKSQHQKGESGTQLAEAYQASPTGTEPDLITAAREMVVFALHGAFWCTLAPNIMQTWPSLHYDGKFCAVAFVSASLALVACQLMVLLVGPGHSQLRRAINLLGYWSEVTKSSEVGTAARATSSPTPWEPFHIYTHGDLVTRPGTDSPAAVYRAEGQTVYADPATPSARIVRALFGPTHGLQKTLLAVESALLLSCIVLVAFAMLSPFWIFYTLLLAAHATVFFAARALRETSPTTV